MDKALFLNLAYYGFIGLLILGFLAWIIAEIVASRPCVITSKDIVQGKLAPTRDINKTTPRVKMNLSPEEFDSKYRHDNAFVFSKDLGRIYIDRSISGYSIVIHSGTHIVVDGTLGCKHLIARHAIESGKALVDWNPNWHPRYGIAEATRIICG